jgi:hypothetical protein
MAELRVASVDARRCARQFSLAVFGGVFTDDLLFGQVSRFDKQL